MIKDWTQAWSELSRTWGISPTKLGDLTEMSREYTAIYHPIPFESKHNGYFKK